MTPLISVIVPVYNVEEYLDRCVQSIVDQTYENLEIILVDDGSTDSSGKKCDKWKAKDNRIVVIHKENGGLSDARNLGLDMAKGEYIGFVDSDDLINTNMYQILFDAINQSKSNIAECRWVQFGDGDEIDNIGSVIKDRIVYSAEEALLELIHERNIKQTVVNKLYRKEVILVRFPVGRINEDEFWTYQVVGKSRRVVFVDAELYYYYQRRNSIMHASYSPRRIDGVYALKERMNYVREHYPTIFADACLLYLWTCFYHYQVICRNKEVDRDSKYRKMLHSEYRNHFQQEALLLMPLKQRVWMRLFRAFPTFTCRIRNKLKIGL